MDRFPFPDADNHYLHPHIRLLLASYRRWTGQELVPSDGEPTVVARRVWEAPFAVVSHTADAEPRFNYGNRAALALFALSWDEFTRLPSRLSAPPLHQDERARMLAAVERQGYISDYRGIRIARDGRRFWIEQGVVWNLVDEDGTVRGQAATFSRWTPLES